MRTLTPATPLEYSEHSRRPFSTTINSDSGNLHINGRLVIMIKRLESEEESSVLGKYVLHLMCTYILNEPDVFSHMKIHLLKHQDHHRSAIAQQNNHETWEQAFEVKRGDLRTGANTHFWLQAPLQMLQYSYLPYLHGAANRGCSGYTLRSDSVKTLFTSRSIKNLVVQYAYGPLRSIITPGMVSNASGFLNIRTPASFAGYGAILNLNLNWASSLSEVMGASLVEKSVITRPEAYCNLLNAPSTDSSGVVG
uniref:Uncharacterized protein n=1 Tax=Timema douglasi TaxID=61478 RepID=A0A7R8VSW6_TIMDO|nr:unnamed protein product [Timema douglasi]